MYLEKLNINSKQMNSQRLFIAYKSIIALGMALLVLSSCNQFEKSDSEIAIKKYVQRTFYQPDTYNAVRYFPPREMKVSTDPKDRNNSSLSEDKNKIVDGWGIAVNISAMTRNGEVSTQSAAFYLNAKCDSVIFSDVAPQFLKADSLSIFGSAH